MSAPVGLIAGLGRLPFELAAGARRRGHRVAAVALAGLADPALAESVDAFESLPVGQLERLFAFLRGEGVKQVALAGKVPKRLLFEAPGRVQPDARAAALLGALGDRRDDAILRAFAGALASEGFELLGQAELVPELLAGEGTLGAVAPTPEQLADVAFAWPIAKALGGLDVGQTVVVERGAVLALEAIEGTDAAIRRGCELGRRACVLKVAKPEQDPRFDVPAVGLDTVRILVAGGGGLLALEAGRTLLLQRDAMLREADAAGIALLGVAPGRLPGGGAR